ncbi:Non-structural maintenance of chromosomes element 4-like protein A-like isoform X1 [Oopsacas minuta]|uniref:Non-structural maintenance of chromosomes element 4 n=1 Tax=Oopsacas minuta TaxID=111878 RepID=A0AAV7KFE0_9METZ|nr:Non-structural maintenance of chromosomes element 4-like protein A-like isoform X1 [Oopsacas minuta]
MDTNEEIVIPQKSELSEGQDDITLRRQLRQKYRDVIRDTRKESKNLAVPSDDRLFQKVQCSSELFQSVRQAREGALDSHLLRLVSEISKAKADAFQAESVSFDENIFISKLQPLISYTPNSETKQGVNSWNKLIDICHPVLCTCPPSMTIMRGSMEVSPPKPRAKREHPQSQKSTNVVSKPKEVKKTEISHSDDTKTAVEWLYKYLQVACDEVGKVFIWDFIIDPESYTASVENMFHLTFLIKDGRCDLFEEEGWIYLKACKGMTEHEISKRHHRQFVFSLSQDKWQEMIQEFNIQDALVSKQPTNSI